MSSEVYFWRVPRILHTSDWHLGLELGGHSRLAEQERFLGWLLQTCQERKIDALLVCGDVFDVLHPPVEAQTLLARFLVDFHRALPAAQAILIAGNHDSPTRLEAPVPFANALGRIRLVGHWRPDRPTDHLIPIPGPGGDPQAICLAVPFLRSQDLLCRVEPDQSPEEARSKAIGEVYASLRRIAGEIHPNLPVVCTGHLTLTGTRKAGSERLLIGGVESVPASALAADTAYTALGHIHRMQTAGSPQAMYSGSPLAMDFDETRHEHVVLLVDIAPEGAPSIESIPVPVAVPLLRMGGPGVDWESLTAEVVAFDWDPWRELPRSLSPLVELSFREDGPVVDLRERTDALVADLPVRMVGAPRIHRAVAPGEAPERIRTDLGSPDAPLRVLETHWLRHHGVEPPDDLVACFNEAVEAVRGGGGA